jgi:isopentenyldiphosphate isomerase
LVFQKRSDNKEFLPGLYDISAAGHLAAGEKAIQGVREIEEELGIQVSEADLISSGYRVDALKQDTFINKEFPEVFYLFDDRVLTEYTLQEDELSGLIEIPVEDCLKLFSDQTESVEVDFVDTNKNFSRINVMKKDFVERADNYFLKTAIMAERLLEGKPIAA